MTDAQQALDCDVLLVGAGIMSATIGVLLKELDLDLHIECFERLEGPALESTDAANNAGTGHSALCELNYTPEKDGVIDVKSARKVMECFEVSKQLWSWLVAKNALPEASSFIHSVPHISFVSGEEDCAFLHRRQQALSALPLFRHMTFTTDASELAEWMPLVMRSRHDNTAHAATRSLLGTDVNFGELTRGLFAHLKSNGNVEPWFQHHVSSLRHQKDGRWLATIHDQTLDIEREVRAKFVFIGAGGGALELLEDCDIEEGHGYGGFPVSGQWLVCKNPSIIEQHSAKVYGKAKAGTPPMSVPHLDSRYLNGKKSLLFGPFAGFSTKFLTKGSYLDMPLSFTIENLIPMLSAGLHNVPLTQYLLHEVTRSFDERIESLREYFPEANGADWEIQVAGQRVQVIKEDGKGGGKLEFGTEIVSAKDNSLAALLGASPGASTSVSVALDLLADCFPEQMATPRWQSKLREMFPSYGHSLHDDETLAMQVRARTHDVLGLPRDRAAGWDAAEQIHRTDVRAV